MGITATKGDWVRIEQEILSPEDRSQNLPDSTRNVPLMCQMNGFLINSVATIGEKVEIATLAGRRTTGTIVEVQPLYAHNFGTPQPTLQQVGTELRELLKAGGESHE